MVAFPVCPLLEKAAGSAVSRSLPTRWHQHCRSGASKATGQPRAAAPGLAFPRTSGCGHGVWGSQRVATWRASCALTSSRDSMSFVQTAVYIACFFWVFFRDHSRRIALQKRRQPNGWNGPVACVLSDQKINILKKLTLPHGICIAVSSLVLCRFYM